LGSNAAGDCPQKDGCCKVRLAETLRAYCHVDAFRDASANRTGESRRANADAQTCENTHAKSDAD